MLALLIFLLHTFCFYLSTIIIIKNSKTNNHIARKNTNRPYTKNVNKICYNDNTLIHRIFYNTNEIYYRRQEEQIWL